MNASTVKYWLLGVVAFNLFTGWLPTDTNTVDAISMWNFIAAAGGAYVAGLRT
jgi:hypothetical protein